MEFGYKKSLNYSIVYVAVTIATSFLNFVVNILLSHNVPIDTFGTFVFLTNLIMIMALVYGSYSSTIAESVSSTYGKQTSWKSILPHKDILIKSIYVSIFTTVLWVMIVPILGEKAEIDTSILYSFTPVISFLLLYGIFRGVLSGYFYFGLISIIIFIESIVRSSIILLDIYLGHTILLYLSLPISIGLAFILTLLFINSRLRKNKSRPDIEIDPSNKMFISFLIISITSSTIFMVDMILVKILFSPSIAGQYALLSIIGKILIIINGLTSYLFLLFASYEKNDLQKRRVFGMVISMHIFIGLIYVLAFGIFGNYTVTLLLGENASLIKDYLIYYTISIVMISLSELFVLYHILRRDYKYIFITIGTGIFIFSGITIFHEEIRDIVNVIFYTGVIAIIFSVLLHFIHSVKSGRFSILKELLFIFKRCPVEGDDYILFLNRKSLSHPEAGGAEIYDNKISEYLNKTGRKIIFITNNEENSINYEGDNKIHRFRIGGFVSSYILIPLYIIIHLRKKISVVVDSHNAIPLFSPIYLRGKKIVLVIHHIHTDVFNKHLPMGFSHFANFLESFLMPKIYRKSKVAIASKSSYEDAIRIGFKKDQINIIYNGIEIEQPSVEKYKGPLITYIGRIEKYKRIGLLIEAFEKISEQYPNAHLAIGGTGKHLNDLKQYVTDSNIHNKVSFLGFINEIDKAHILSSSWVCVQPSEMEGWGITVIESNRCGTPVIGFNVPGIRDSIIPNKTGLICVEQNIDELIKNIIVTISNDSLRKEMEIEAKKWSMEFSWEKSGALFKKLIDNYE